MKIQEIRERSENELATLTRQLREDLYKLNVQKTTNQLENTNSIHLVKRDLARVMTIVNARKIGIEQKKETAK